MSNNLNIIENTKENIISDITQVISITTIDNKLLNVSIIHLDKYLIFQEKEEIKKIIILLTNNSDCVKSIIHIVELIMEDGKIDINDAPLLLSFIKKLINTQTLNLNISSENYINIIKYVLIILTKENILKIPNQEDFIINISKLLDSLKMVEEVYNSVNTCFPWISKLSCTVKY